LRLDGEADGLRVSHSARYARPRIAMYAIMTKEDVMFVYRALRVEVCSRVCLFAGGELARWGRLLYEALKDRHEAHSSVVEEKV
jgi:hypothetical protein